MGPIDNSPSLWEILVPTEFDPYWKVPLEHHHTWDSKVREISNGITIFSPAKGQWVSPDGTVWNEKMIPVRIACSFKDIERIADFTAEHYRQKAVMYYEVSSYVVIKHYT